MNAVGAALLVVEHLEHLAEAGFITQVVLIERVTDEEDSCELATSSEDQNQIVPSHRAGLIHDDSLAVPRPTPHKAQWGCLDSVVLLQSDHITPW